LIDDDNTGEIFEIFGARDTGDDKEDAEVVAVVGEPINVEILGAGDAGDGEAGDGEVVGTTASRLRIECSFCIAHKALHNGFSRGIGLKSKCTQAMFTIRNSAMSRPFERKTRGTCTLGCLNACCKSH
jgi:hypothetical protein